MASLDHAMWFHRPFRVDEWLLYDQWTPSTSDARGLAMGQIYTQDGRLVVTVVQEGSSGSSPERCMTALRVGQAGAWPGPSPPPSSHSSCSPRAPARTAPRAPQDRAPPRPRRRAPRRLPPRRPGSDAATTTPAGGTPGSASGAGPDLGT
jgi:hypothetical protein